MINILAGTGSIPEAAQYVDLGHRLETLGVRLHLLTPWPSVAAHVEKLGWRDIVLLDSKKAAERGQPDLLALMDRFRNPTVAEIISSEQVFGRWPMEKRLRLFAANVEFFDDYFSRHDIRCVVIFPTTGITFRLAYAVARARGMRTLVISPGPIVTETSIYNDVDEGWTWSEFVETYAKSLPVTDEMREIVAQAIEKITLEKQRSMKAVKGNVFRFAYRVARTSLQVLRTGKPQPSMWRDHCRGLQFEMGRLLRPLIRYNQPDPEEKFIFFPLHMWFDAQVATRNPMFRPQAALVEMLSLATPPGYKVYVKEHPYYNGGVNYDIHAKCRRLENVEVIHPAVSSMELLEHAAAVVSINSTAGWEAILMKTPLVVLGSPYYADFRLAYRVDNLNDLPRQINAALLDGKRRYQDNEDEWVRFIHAVVSTAKPESMLFYKSYMGLGRNLSEHRLNTLARNLYDAALAGDPDPEREHSAEEPAQSANAAQ